MAGPNHETPGPAASVWSPLWVALMMAMMLTISARMGRWGKWGPVQPVTDPVELLERFAVLVVILVPTAYLVDIIIRWQERKK